MNNDNNLYTHGLAVGVFDLFHVGHLRYLKHVRSKCSQMTVLVASDAVVLDKKQKKTIISEDDRVEILQGLNWIDDIQLIHHSMDDTEKTLKKFNQIKPTHIFIGDDWKGTERWARIEPSLLELGAQLIFVPRTSHISSSKIRQSIRPQKLVKAC